MEKKKWYKSRTLWVNAIAIAAIMLSHQCGIDLSGAETGGILGMINMVLRLVTGTGLEA